MEMQEVFSRTEARMEKTIHALHIEYDSVRAGRATATVLDKIHVDYYGTPTPIEQMASVTVAEARILTIQPWDASMLHPIEKAIQVSDLGINPQNDGRVLRLVFPPLTEDRRKELVKVVHKTAEDTKIAIRSVRRDSMEKLKAMKKASEITEDDWKDGEEQLQHITDRFVKKIDGIEADKEKEIMEI